MFQEVTLHFYIVYYFVLFWWLSIQYSLKKCWCRTFFFTNPDADHPFAGGWCGWFVVWI